MNREQNRMSCQRGVAGGEELCTSTSLADHLRASLLTGHALPCFCGEDPGSPNFKSSARFGEPNLTPPQVALRLCDLGSPTGPTPGLMPCCCCLEIIHDFPTKEPIRPYKFCSQPSLSSQLPALGFCPCHHSPEHTGVPALVPAGAALTQGRLEASPPQPWWSLPGTSPYGHLLSSDSGLGLDD